MYLLVRFIYLVLCIDAKLTMPSKEIFKLRDWSQEDPRDTEAARAGIKLYWFRWIHWMYGYVRNIH